jgi:hypothetical protein
MKRTPGPGRPQKLDEDQRTRSYGLSMRPGVLTKLRDLAEVQSRPMATVVEHAILDLEVKDTRKKISRGRAAMADFIKEHFRQRSDTEREVGVTVFEFMFRGEQRTVVLTDRAAYALGEGTPTSNGLFLHVSALPEVAIRNHARVTIDLGDNGRLDIEPPR